MIDVTQALANGLLMGALYVLISIGLTMVFGVMKIVNFAHGELLMLPMYAVFWIWQFTGLDPLVSMIPVMLTFFVIGLVTEKFLIDPTLRKPLSAREKFLNTFLITLGLAMILQNLALTFWHADYRTVTTSYADVIITLGTVRFYIARLIAGIGALSFTAFLYIFLKKTDIGKAMRATSQDREAAALMGINVSNMFAISFGIGAACVAAAGALLSTFYHIFPTVGTIFLMVAFLVVIMGGAGSFIGALIGGLMVGLAESIGAAFVSAQWSAVIIFVMFVTLVTLKPGGLFKD